MKIKSSLLALSALAALPLQGAMAADKPAAKGSSVTWSTPESTVVVPSKNIDLDGWEEYKNKPFKPSQNQYLSDPILIGSIDLHAHFGPDSYARQWDAFEIAKMAKERGMRGLVLKNHWSESAGITNLVRKYAGVDGLEVFGGLALDTPEGGINPQAVRYFAEVIGGHAKIVWFPTHDSEHEVKFTKATRPYVVVSRNGKLVPEVFEVLDLIKQYDLTLATGHVTSVEMLQIMAAAKQRGITKIIMTHPGLGPMFTDPTIDQLKQGVALGGYAEIVASELFGKNRANFVDMIRQLGPEHCVVSTDSGLVGTPNHPDAMVMAIRILREAGFSDKDLDLMFRRNPAVVLGLKPLS